jgi:3-oxoacyl-(acyl-carrier-protein) synthase
LAERSNRRDFYDFYFSLFSGVAAAARFLGTSMASKFLVSACNSSVELVSGARRVVAVGCVMTDILGGQLLK